VVMVVVVVVMVVVVVTAVIWAMMIDEAVIDMAIVDLLLVDVAEAAVVAVIEVMTDAVAQVVSVGIVISDDERREKS